jgi:hypothetical protein
MKKKTVIGWSYELERTAETETKQRRKTFALLCKLFEQYEVNAPTVTELRAYTPTELFLKRYKEANAGAIPKHLSDKDALHLLKTHGIETSELQLLEREWLALRLPFDNETLKSTVDCNIYADNEEQTERFNDLLELHAAVNTFVNKYGARIGLNKAIFTISNGGLNTNMNTGKIEPSIFWIKQTM